MPTRMLLRSPYDACNIGAPSGMSLDDWRKSHGLPLEIPVPLERFLEYGAWFQQQIAPDVKYHVWTFDGTAPGPVIRVHLGDTVHFTLTNNSSIGMQHSIDFHAAMTPWDKNYQPVDPGQTKTFDWVAMYPGVFMYHCGVPPVLEHIANGMYGAIVVEPNNLPEEREYVLVSSEFYPGAKPVNGVYEGDYNKLFQADKAIEAVTAADVQRVAKKYFTAKNRTVAALVPEKPEVKQ